MKERHQIDLQTIHWRQLCITFTYLSVWHYIGRSYIQYIGRNGPLKRFLLISEISWMFCLVHDNYWVATLPVPNGRECVAELQNFILPLDRHYPLEPTHSMSPLKLFQLLFVYTSPVNEVNQILSQRNIYTAVRILKIMNRGTYTYADWNANANYCIRGWASTELQPWTSSFDGWTLNCILEFEVVTRAWLSSEKHLLKFEFGHKSIYRWRYIKVTLL